MKRFRDTEAWKFIRTAIEILLIVAVVYGLILLYTNFGFGEAKSEESYEIRYVLCKDYVYVRMSPNKKQEPIGRLETGDVVYVDGQRRNGYVHCVDLSFEYSEGWIFAGYLTEYKPEALWQDAVIVSKGRLAARKYVNGRRTRWLKPGATLKVYYWSDSWSLTNCGYVQTMYLELVGD